METGTETTKGIRINRHKHKQYLVVLFLVFLVACSKGELYSDFKGIENATWDKNKSCDFVVEVTDTTRLYDVVLEIRNKNDYPFRNLWLFVQMKTPEGNVRKDTLNCELADPEGKWYGRGLSLYVLNFPYEQKISFPRSGNYTYSIRQGMRADQLKGISDIGLRVIEHSDQ